jgi:predicted alpha/beta-fold hydrolase
MVLAAADDPWISIEQYCDVKWSANPWLLPVIPSTGGHVGFHGDASGRSWSDLALEKFLERIATIEA